MFQFSILIGVYSYSIFTLGVLGLLKNAPLVFDTVLFFLVFLFISNKKLLNYIKCLPQFLNSLDYVEKVLIFILSLVALVNLIGVFGPELGFDALWYHLTIPKIFLTDGKIFYIQGSLFYYSTMPKLLEMLYIPALAFGNETTAKMIHFVFGIGSVLVIYKLARQFISQKLSLLACLIFYSNLVVAWLSITSYVDLGRTFYEITSIYYLVLFLKSKNFESLLISAVLMGFASEVKIISLFDIVIVSFALLYFTKSIKNAFIFGIVSALVVVPWFVFSYLNTRNPVYPFLTGQVTGLNIGQVNLLNFIHSPDPISPIYIIFLPVIIVTFRKFNTRLKVLTLYSALSLIIWFLFEQSGGGRFITAYLPVYSILCSVVYDKTQDKLLKNILFLAIIFISIVTVFYRGAANIKYVPVLIGLETRQQFLSKNLNFSFGDFSDTDGYLGNKIKKSDRVLVFGIHNLYYADFPFIDSSYYKKGEYFDYVLVRGSLPNVFEDWKLVYQNDKTNVKLYSQK